MTDDALRKAELLALNWSAAFNDGGGRVDTMAAVIMDLVTSHRAVNAQLAAVEAERDHLRQWRATEASLGEAIPSAATLTYPWGQVYDLRGEYGELRPTPPVKGEPG